MSAVSINRHHIIVSELKANGYTDCDINGSFDNSYYKMMHKALNTIDAMGYDYFLKNSIMGSKMKNILTDIIEKL